MEKAEHDFATGVVRSFTAWADLTKKVAAEFDSLRNRIVEYENKAKNLEFLAETKKQELEKIEQITREKRLIMDAGVGQLRDELNKRRNEVADREARMIAREAQLRDQQTKLDNLLSIAEKKMAKLKD